MRRLALPLLVALLVPACDGGGSSSGAAEKSADGFTKVPNINGISAKVPANATPNGIGGAAGFHSDDDSFGFMLNEVTADALSKSFEDAKKGTEEILFKKWVTSEKTDSGWVLTHEAPKVELDGDEMKEVGSVFAFEVRTKVGDKTYKCYGSVAKEENLAAVVEACKTLKAS